MGLRWQMLSLRVRRAGLNLLQRGLILLAEDKTVAAQIEEQNQEFDTKQKSVEQNALFSAVGLALSFWSQTEENLVAITGMLLRTKFQMAGLIMYSIINFHVRLNIIDELFSMSPHYGSLKPKWNKVHEKLKALQDMRDRLAHHTVYSGRRSDEATLSPGRFDSRKKSKKHQPLTRDQIWDFTHSLTKVTHDTAELIDAMTALDETREKSSE
jgi:hypothetical protein